MNEPVQRVLTALETHGRRVRRTGSGATAQCPAHDDRDPSLSVSEGDDGRALLNCHAGCALDDILQALDLDHQAIFPDKPTDGPGPVVATYTYLDETGKPVLRVTRHTPKSFRQQANDHGVWVNKVNWLTPEQRFIPYRLPELLAAIDDDRTVYVVEGEKDADAMWDHGYAATCNAGGAGKWNDLHTRWLVDAPEVVIVADRDQAGLEHAEKVSSSLFAASVPWSIVQPAEGKDAHDHLAAGLGADDFQPVAVDQPDPAHFDPVESHGWEPVDLAPMLTEGWEPPQPTLLELPDGRHLFYAGRVNALIGESGAGKSWVSQLLVAQLLIAGWSVLVVDLEDHAGSYVDRLRRLGVPHDALISRFVYISPDAPLGDTARDALLDLVADRAFQAVVIDSTGEAMALDAAKPNDDDDTARWFRRFPRAVAELGPGVLILDHLPKDPNRPGGFAIGSQRKRAAIDGAMFEVRAIHAPVKGETGRLRLRCGKDRSGFWKHGEDVVDVVVEDVPGGTIRVDMEAPDNKSGPTIKMEAVSRFLEENGPSSARKITEKVPGKAEVIRQAALRLTSEGYAKMTTRSGKGGGHVFEIVTPYRRDEAEMGVTANRVPTASQPRPSAVPMNASSQTAYRVPPRNERGDGDAVGSASVDGGNTPRNAKPRPDETQDPEHPHEPTLEDF